MKRQEEHCIYNEEFEESGRIFLSEIYELIVSSYDKIHHAKFGNMIKDETSVARMRSFSVSVFNLSGVGKEGKLTLDDIISVKENSDEKMLLGYGVWLMAKMIEKCVNDDYLEKNSEYYTLTKRAKEIYEIKYPSSK